ncbi:MAG: ROK family protein [Elusimicrobiaceae bacterium]|nr:ROK family protein [Elusimicrobiaceae bacterium]
MIAVGIDIGGTFTKFIAVDQKGKVLKNIQLPTNIKLNKSAFINQLANQVKIWQKDFKGQKLALGVGIAGDTDDKKGILHFAPNIPWHNFEIAKLLKAKTGFACFVCNDANMAAWGIYAYEFKRKYKNLIIITLGTGVGSGFIIEGKLYQGSCGSAGEIGHLKVDFSKEALKCACGHKGCLEAYIGTNGLKTQMQFAAKNAPKSILAKLLKENKFSVKLLSEAASLGDKNALKIWHNFGSYLAQALSDAVLLLNPQVIVLAGGIAKGSKYFKPAMQEVFKKQVIKRPFKNLKILLAKQKDIGALGAALYALSKYEK